MGGLVGGWISEWVDEQVSGWNEGWCMVGGWEDGRMDRQMERDRYYLYLCMSGCCQSTWHLCVVGKQKPFPDGRPKPWAQHSTGEALVTLCGVSGCKDYYEQQWMKREEFPLCEVGEIPSITISM